MTTKTLKLTLTLTLSRNLNNINNAKEKTGRVPAGMQIKVTPEVLGCNEIKFQQAWAQALTQAEETLSSCIEEHLNNYIQNTSMLGWTKH